MLLNSLKSSLFLGQIEMTLAPCLIAFSVLNLKFLERPTFII